MTESIYEHAEACADQDAKFSVEDPTLSSLCALRVSAFSALIYGSKVDAVPKKNE